MSDELNQLLNAYWLRPESALWRAIDIKTMKLFEFSSPSLDLGCGDGMFSFIRAGGELDSSFDVFQATAGLDQFFEKVDVYDAFHDSLSPLVTKKPAYRIDCAFDQKQNLLKKASLLGLYDSFKVGDANGELPYADNSFASIFSNIVYWLSDPTSVLKEIARILKPRGTICLMLPNKTLPEFSFFNQLYVNGSSEWAFLEWLDRGRLTDNIKQAKGSEEWETLFATAGLRVQQHQMHLSKTVIQIWDIGMRPLFPTLLKMVKAIGPDTIGAIKAEWITTMKHFLHPFVEMDARLTQGQEPAFHCYLLTKD